MENISVQTKPSFKKRLLIAIPLFLFFLGFYYVAYSIVVEASTWGGTYPYHEDLSKPDRFYIVIIWPIIMFLTAIVPPILVLTGKRALLWILLSITGMIISFVSGWGWLFILEITHK